jgi:hypothetical protein
VAQLGQGLSPKPKVNRRVQIGRGYFLRSDFSKSSSCFSTGILLTVKRETRIVFGNDTVDRDVEEIAHRLCGQPLSRCVVLVAKVQMFIVKLAGFGQPFPVKNFHNSVLKTDQLGLP